MTSSAPAATLRDTRIRARSWRPSHDAVTGWLFALPVLLYFVVWVFAPVLAALGLTFMEWNGLAPLSEARFVGLANVSALLHDRAFLSSFRNTFLYTAVVVGSGTACGLLLALAVNAVTRFSGLVRAIYFAPVVLPMTAMALLWGLLYQPAYGLFNQLLGAVGLPPGHWLYGTESALLSVCLLVFWKSLGWYMLIFLAGLRAIPDEFYEAAKIDGAGAWVRFWSVTLPLLKPTTLFVLIVSCIDGLQVFSPVYIMTQGGPANATDTVVFHMYITAFDGLRFSYATGMAVALFLVILVITLVQLRLMRDGGVVSHY
jgi:multiple sugar transport system permease protein